MNTVSFEPSFSPAVIFAAALLVRAAVELVKRARLMPLLEKVCDEPAWFVTLIVSVAVCYFADGAVPQGLQLFGNHAADSVVAGLALSTIANGAHEVLGLMRRGGKE